MLPRPLDGVQRESHVLEYLDYLAMLALKRSDELTEEDSALWDNAPEWAQKYAYAFRQ
jgi:hypothetical protein